MESQDVNCVEGIVGVAVIVMGVAVMGMVAVGVAVVGRSFTCVTDVSIVWRRSCCQPPGSPARSVAS